MQTVENGDTNQQDKKAVVINAVDKSKPEMKNIEVVSIEKDIDPLPDQEESYDDDYEEIYDYDYGENHCGHLICNTDDLQPLWGINKNTIIKKYKVCEVFANRGCIERAACEFKRGGKKNTCFIKCRCEYYKFYYLFSLYSMDS